MPRTLRPPAAARKPARPLHPAPAEQPLMACLEKGWEEPNLPKCREMAKVGLYETPCYPQTEKEKANAKD